MAVPGLDPGSVLPAFLFRSPGPAAKSARDEGKPPRTGLPIATVLRMTAGQPGSSILRQQPSRQVLTAGRKAWQPPRVARLDAGSAEDGASNNEDGSFSAS
jgi:hypothetical protein